MDIVKVESGDGTATLYNKNLEEGYHSSFGALNETLHIFIENGLKRIINRGVRSINILEVGYGTALNCLATTHHIFSIKKELSEDIKVNYLAVESNPVEEKLLLSLNHTALFPTEFSHIVEKIYSAEWGVKNRITKEVTLTPLYADILEVARQKCTTKLPEGAFNLTYFDPFSPKVNPELWSEELFTFLYRVMADESIVVTYSSKGEVRRALEQSGFEVRRVAGPKGKRHITVAIKGSLLL